MGVLDVEVRSRGSRIRFHCPGCRCSHVIHCGGENDWTFDGNLERPTFSPSILVTGVRPITDDEIERIERGEHVEPEPRVCHSFIRDGQIQFLGDCTHHLAGQTVPMTDVRKPEDEP